MKSSPINIIFIIAALCVGPLTVLGQTSKFNYTQYYKYWVPAKVETVSQRNQGRFTTTIMGDFSDFDENTKIGIYLGDMNVLQNVGDVDNEIVQITTIGDALAQAENGYAKVKIDQSKGKGYINTFLKVLKTYQTTVGETEKIVKVMQATIHWNAKKLKITVLFDDTWNEDNSQVITEFPINYKETLDQWTSNPFSLELEPLTVYFGDKVYTSGVVNIEGRSKFNSNNELVTASGKVKKRYLASTDNAYTLTMAVSPAETDDESAGGDTVPLDGKSYMVVGGDKINIVANSASGYNFVNWTSTGNTVFADATKEETTVTVTGNSTITANFIATATLTLAVSPSDTGTTAPTAGEGTTVDTQTAIAITAEPATDYHFSSWSVGENATVADSKSAKTTVTLTGDATVTANFEHDTATLTMAVSSDVGGSVSPAVGAHTINTNTATTIIATIATNYSFSGWTLTGEGTLADSKNAETTVTLTGDATVTANFTRDATTLTMAVSPSGAGTTTPSIGSNTANTNETISIVATAASNYQFAYWTIDGSGEIANANVSNTTITLTGATTLTAHFDALTDYANLTINSNPTYGGSTNPGSSATHSVNKNQAITVTATAASNYHFTSWSLEGEATIANSKSASTTVTLKGNATLTANFSANTGTADLTMAVSPSGGGSVNPGAGTHTVQKGEPQVVIAVAASGYTFSKWTVSGGGTIDSVTSSETIATLTGDATITAEFTKN